MRKFEGIVESTTTPESKNLLWIDNGTLKYYKNGQYEALGSGSADVSADLDNIESRIPDYVADETLLFDADSNRVNIDVLEQISPIMQYKTVYIKTENGVLKPATSAMVGENAVMMKVYDPSDYSKYDMYLLSIFNNSDDPHISYEQLPGYNIIKEAELFADETKVPLPLLKSIALQAQSGITNFPFLFNNGKYGEVEIILVEDMPSLKITKPNSNQYIEVTFSPYNSDYFEYTKTTKQETTLENPWPITISGQLGNGEYTLDEVSSLVYQLLRELNDKGLVQFQGPQ